MKKSELQKYQLRASIHTVEIRSDNKPDIFKCMGCGPVYLDKSDIWKVKVNPNDYGGDIFSYSHLTFLMDSLFFDGKLENPFYYRTDIRLDSYEDNFQDYYKLNLLLISLFAMLFNDSNYQAIAHFLTQSKEFSDISSQNQYWQVKYYNKKFQTNDRDPAKARLEFRSLKSTRKSGYLPIDIKAKWFNKLDKLPALYENLQKQCNQDLLVAYEEYCKYNSKQQRKRDLLTEFFSNYSNGLTVFTRKQLVNFLIECGIEPCKAKDRAEYIIGKCNMEFFSKTTLIEYIEMIKSSMDTFFDN